MDLMQDFYDQFKVLYDKRYTESAVNMIYNLFVSIYPYAVSDEEYDSRI